MLVDGALDIGVIEDGRLLMERLRMVCAAVEHVRMERFCLIASCSVRYSNASH